MKETESYVSLILSVFLKMDIDYLRKNLRDNYSYQEAPKEIFLMEIEDIFKAHRTSGDNELFIFKGASMSGDCANCGKSGFRFIGDKSHNYFDLIFQIESDDIKDIFTCNEFETEENSGELGVQACIYINEDDQVSFEKTPEYLNKLNNALSAFNELISTPPRVIKFEDCDYWIRKHTFLYESLGGSNIFTLPMKWSKFLDLYYELNEWSEFLGNSFILIKEAISELNVISTEEESREIFNIYGSNDGVDLSSVKYHLKRRKEAKDIGFDIPLYLNKKNHS